MNSKLNGSTPSKLLRHFHCTSCRLRFFIKDFVLKGSRCPMLLQCGHSLCQGCLQQALKITKNIVCQQCGFVSQLDSTDQIERCFPFNMYAVGSVVILQNSRHENMRKLALLTKEGDFEYAIKGQSRTDTKADSFNGSICEECSLTTSWYCENCKSNYCDLCWSKVHGSAKSLMKHFKVPISCVEKSTNGLMKCPEHESQFLEFFCCSSTICSYCLIHQHQGEGHCPVTLQEKNLEMLSKMKTAAEEAEKMKKRMTHTLERVRLAKTSPEGPSAKELSALESQIAEKFSRMHGILQLEEDRLMKKLHEKLNKRGDTLSEIQLQLEKQMEYVEGLLREYEFALKKPHGRDLMDLNRQLSEVEHLPCYLVWTKADDREVTISFDESVLDRLQTYCKMDLPSDESFQLLSGSNLPEEFAVEPLDLVDSEQGPDHVTIPAADSSFSAVDTGSNCSSRDLGKGDFEPLPQKPQTDGKIFQEKKNYSVRVSYIKNPGEFYVILNSQRLRQQAIDKRASQVASSIPAAPETVSKDELCLVQYNVDKKWYRARVIKFYPAKNSEGEDHVLVYYLDYGNSEKVPMRRLRPIAPDMLEPPLAFKCKLFDCVPKNDDWCPESTKTMEKILNNHTATMFVMKVHQDCLEVDLSVIYPEGQIGRDIVSVRDALLFLEFSSFVNGPSHPHRVNAVKYPSQCLPAAGEEFDCVITHVNSPDDFYVHRMREDTSFLYKLSIDLQNYYRENFKKGFFFKTVIGMPCAALFPSDQKWYRAKIIDTPCKKMVTVFYVDYGNTGTISERMIRKLKENFAKRPPMALNCALAGILPKDWSWKPETKAQLDKLLLVRNCSVRVEGQPNGEQKIEVLLYEEENGRKVCVNRMLVCCGQAVENPDSFLVLDAEEENGRNSEEESAPPRKATRFNDRKKQKLRAKALWEKHESEKKSPIYGDAGETDSDSDVDEHNNIFKVKVKILSAESPSSIYVTLPSLKVELKNLQSELAEFYKNTSPTDGMEWKEEDKCAVYDPEKDCWYRATVLSALPDDRVKVFLKDIAQESTVPASELRELNAAFTKYPTCAVRCHLADIAPPGEKWPDITSEYLLKELENYKEIFMTKRGQIENKSLPVELWVKKIILKGALEPNSEKWVTLNRILVRQGLAVPLKQKLWCTSSSSNEECSDCEKKTGGEKVKDVAEDSETVVPTRWLPPEPLKTTNFVGIPTYVDSNAFIYLHDADEDGGKLRTISRSLLTDHENWKPEPEDHFWSEGQVCIARYHLDDSWYRGLILKANEDAIYDVLFVDYGNVEVCQARDLSRRIKMQEIPILTHKCQLQGITPVAEDGKWSVSGIDFMHSLIVEKKCQVTVHKTPLDPNEPNIVSLKIVDSDIDVGTYLIEQNLATITCSVSDYSDSHIPKKCFQDSVKIDEGSVVPLYVPLSLPVGCRGLFIAVTKIKSETEFFANIVDDDSLRPDLKRVLKDFEILQRKLTPEECSSQPLVEKAVKGHPCCCINVNNKKWSRAEIINCIKQENSVFVIFVDYGNKEFYNKDSLHKCKNEWLTVPKMALEFKLAGVRRRFNVPRPSYMKALTSCLNKGPLFAEILTEHEGSFEVRLFAERNGCLAYQNMIDNELMELI